MNPMKGLRRVYLLPQQLPEGAAARVLENTKMVLRTFAQTFLVRMLSPSTEMQSQFWCQCSPAFGRFLQTIGETPLLVSLALPLARELAVASKPSGGLWFADTALQLVSILMRQCRDNKEYVDEGLVLGTLEGLAAPGTTVVAAKRTGAEQFLSELLTHLLRATFTEFRHDVGRKLSVLFDVTVYFGSAGAGGGHNTSGGSGETAKRGMLPSSISQQSSSGSGTARLHLITGRCFTLLSPTPRTRTISRDYIARLAHEALSVQGGARLFDTLPLSAQIRGLVASVVSASGSGGSSSSTTSNSCPAKTQPPAAVALEAAKQHLRLVANGGFSPDEIFVEFCSAVLACVGELPANFQSIPLNQRGTWMEQVLEGCSTSRIRNGVNNNGGSSSSSTVLGNNIGLLTTTLSGSSSSSSSSSSGSSALASSSSSSTNTVVPAQRLIEACTTALSVGAGQNTAFLLQALTFVLALLASSGSGCSHAESAESTDPLEQQGQQHVTAMELNPLRCALHFLDCVLDLPAVQLLSLLFAESFSSVMLEAKVEDAVTGTNATSGSTSSAPLNTYLSLLQKYQEKSYGATCVGVVLLRALFLGIHETVPGSLHGDIMAIVVKLRSRLTAIDNNLELMNQENQNPGDTNSSFDCVSLGGGNPFASSGSATPSTSSVTTGPGHPNSGAESMLPLFGLLVIDAVAGMPMLWYRGPNVRQTFVRDLLNVDTANGPQTKPSAKSTQFAKTTLKKFLQPPASPRLGGGAEKR
ncbi:unnamed protein product [Amoebophrya sp. A25]|nr:unnamed protein product [Amoebophrya sp. A25]|eukprot:GSA25T00017196001.1